MKIALAVPVLMTGMMVAACAEETPTQLANPAAVFCVEQGGRHDIREDATGAKTGICILPDGQEVDAWAYFRENAPD